VAQLGTVRKAEVLRNLEITEYGDNRLSFSMEGNTATITFTAENHPAQDERTVIRDAIVAIDESEYDTFTDLKRAIVEMVEKRIEGGISAYGEKKPKAFSVAFYNVEPEMIAVLVNMLQGSEVSYDTRQTVRKALGVNSSSDW
jgi:hypothetical protein